MFHGALSQIVERELSLQPQHYTEVKNKSFPVDKPLPGAPSASSRRDSARGIPQEAQGLIDVADALLYGGELPVDRDLPPPPPPAIEVIDLAPDVFRSVRLAFGYRFKSFARSVGRHPLKPIGGGGGRSGADFFLTHDARFVVKGIPAAECVLLLKLLESYVDHVISNAKHTLLPRFLGLYKVKLPDAGSNKWQCFVVMPNLFKVHKNTGVQLHCMYDLKGSTYMRETKEAISGDGASDDTGAVNEKVVEKKGARKDAESEWKAKVTEKAPAPQAEESASPEAEEAASGVARCSVSAAPVPLLPPPKISSSVLKDLNFCPHHKPSKKRNPLIRESSSTTSRSLSRSSSSLSSRSLSNSGSGSESGPGGPFVGEDDLSLRSSERSSSAVVEDNEVNVAATDACTRLRLGADRRAVFLANVRNDTAWLEQHDIMDYSLLLGVGRCSNAKTVTEKLERKARRDAMRDAKKNPPAAAVTEPASAAVPATPAATEGSNDHDVGNTSTTTSAVLLRGEEEQFRFGAGDAVQQEKEELEYLLSRGASALSPAETARVQLLMQRSRAPKDGSPSPSPPPPPPAVEEARSYGSSRIGGSAIPGAATAPAAENSSSDEESDEKRLVGGATRRLQDPVSYWENELGGVCACHPTTNLRMTTTTNYGVFGSGHASSSSPGASQRTVSDSKASKLLGITKSGNYFEESRPALYSLPEDVLSTEPEVTKENDDDDVEDEVPTEGAGEGIERSEDMWNENEDADEREWYTFGIIDILQKYDTRKKSEGVLKETIMRNEGVSSVPPKRYAERFISFLEKHTM